MLYWKRKGSKRTSNYRWWLKSCTSWYVVYPTIYKVLYIPDGCLGFLPSTVFLGIKTFIFPWGFLGVQWYPSWWLNQPLWKICGVVNLDHLSRSAGKITKGLKPPPTLLGTNISPKNCILKMIFLFPRWDMLVPWRVDMHNSGSIHQLLQSDRSLLSPNGGQVFSPVKEGHLWVQTRSLWRT